MNEDQIYEVFLAVMRVITAIILTLYTLVAVMTLAHYMFAGLDEREREEELSYEASAKNSPEQKRQL